jgi:acetyl esterase/lipase
MRKYLVNIFVLVAVAGTIFSSCKKAGDENSQLTESIMKDVKFGSDAQQSMDVYLPAGRTSTDTKVIIFIHGGSWSGGDKTDFNEAITAIRPQLTDYAVFNINYRLANSINRHPAQMQDIQSAIDYINSKAGEYNINTSKIGLIGASAGSHLALLQAYKFNTSGKIKAVVDLFGPTNLTTLYNNHPIPQASQPVLVNFLGATPATNATLYFETSPINYVTAQSPPTLILHGDADYIVPVDQSYTLQAKLQANNVKNDMKVYAGQGHGWVGADLNDTYTRAINFIKENVR